MGLGPIATRINLPTLGIIAGGVAAAVGIGIGVTAFATHKRDPEKFVHLRFDKLDRNGSGGLDAGEAVRNLQSTSTVTTGSYRIGDFVTTTHQRQRTTWTESALAAVQKSDADRDGHASFGELADLARSFDTDGNRLSWKEQRRFDDSYGIKTSGRHTQVLDTWSTTSYSPPPKQHDSGGGWGGGTSPGDDYGGGGGGGGYGGNSTDNGNPSPGDF